MTARMNGAGEVVWITGASSGIGAALARAYARRDKRLILSGRNETALADVAAQCGVEHLLLPFDIGEFHLASAAAEVAWEWSGGIDVLVNNAGISHRSLAVETEFAVYQRIIDIDLLGPIALTQALIKRMAARRAGQIVMISSLAGKVGSPRRSAYCAAKHGLIGYADALRIELSIHNVSVIGVTPGTVRTDIWRNAISVGEQKASSGKAYDPGIDPDDFARRMLAAIDAGEREVSIADRELDLMIAQARRTPDALFDTMIAAFKSETDSAQAPL